MSHELYQGPVWRHRSIITERTNVQIHTFQPASPAFEVAFRSRDQVTKGGQGADHEGGMDQVKRAQLETPIVIGTVADLEKDVRGHFGRLNGRQIGADNFGLGEHVGDLDGPHACTRPYIQDPLWIADRRQEEFAMVDSFGTIELDEHAFPLICVIRIQIRVFLVPVIASAPFDGIVDDTVGQ